MILKDWYRVLFLRTMNFDVIRETMIMEFVSIVMLIWKLTQLDLSPSISFRKKSQNDHYFWRF